MTRQFQLIWDLETQDEHAAVMDFMSKILLQKRPDESEATKLKVKAIKQEPTIVSAHITTPPEQPPVVVTAHISSTPTIEEIRKKLTSISQNGKATQVKQLLAKYNAKNVKELKPEIYEQVIVEAEAL